MKNAQAAGEPWKIVIAVVTCLAALLTAIGRWFGSHAARQPHAQWKKSFLRLF